MTKAPTRPRPCTDPNRRGRHSARERVALAVAICEGRDVQMTELRRRVLELLWASGRPTGAYELIEAVKLGDSRSVGPPTVYRALEFLMAQGLVPRIESLNAYVPRAHPERDHDCLFFICGGCRASVELEDPRKVSGDRRRGVRRLLAISRQGRPAGQGGARPRVGLRGCGDGGGCPPPA